MSGSIIMRDGEIPLFTKGRSSCLDYRMDWAAWLDGDSITDAAWNIEGPQGDDPTSRLKNISSAFTQTTATVWLEGGTDGAAYKVSCLITTEKGRKDSRSIRIKIPSH